MSDSPLNAAVSMLAARPYSVNTLTKKLLERGFDEQAVYDVVERLESGGYLDDLEYARTVIRHYFKRGYGRRRVEQELLRRGVNRDTARQALSETPESNEAIDSYVAGLFKSGTPDEKEKRRMVARLERKGFSWQEIRDALARVGELEDIECE